MTKIVNFAGFDFNTETIYTTTNHPSIKAFAVGGIVSGGVFDEPHLLTIDVVTGSVGCASIEIITDHCIEFRAAQIPVDALVYYYVNGTCRGIAHYAGFDGKHHRVFSNGATSKSSQPGSPVMCVDIVTKVDVPAVKQVQTTDGENDDIDLTPEEVMSIAALVRLLS